MTLPKAIENASLDRGTLRALLDALHAPAALVEGSSDEVLYANAAMTRLLGPSRLAGRPCADVFGASASALADRQAPHADGVAWRSSALEESLHLVQPDTPSVPPQAAFVAMLGHELRNPLAPIRHATEMLRADPQAVPKAQPIIERQVAHMTRLVNDLLDAGRASSGRLPIVRETMSVHNAIELARESCERLLARRGHHVKVDIDNIQGVQLQGDLVRLTQVVSNLLSNAAKYTPHGGRITLEAALEGTEVVVVVRDNGRGFTEETAALFFDPFVQAVQPIDRTTGGLGLGLPLVRYIVEQHGGTVTGTSNGPGTGATFTVRIPGASSDAEASASRGESSKPKKPNIVERVLVVDDNEDAAEMMCLILQSRGVDCVVAYDGESALEEMRKAEFPLALVDIGLPGLDGYEVAREAGTLSTRPVQLVALSGYGQRSDIERAMEAGFDAYRVKPISVEDLDALLRP